MVEASEYGRKYDTSERVHRSAERCILAESQVRGDTVIVCGISRQDSAKMRFPQHHDTIEALASDRTDQPSNMAVLTPVAEPVSASLLRALRFAGLSPISMQRCAGVPRI